MNYFSGVDHGTLDQGASLLTSNPLSSAMDSQSRIKGVYLAFWLRCLQSCVWSLNEKYGIKEKKFN